MTKLVDLSVALEAGIVSDPPSMLPEIEYIDHDNGAQELAGMFPGLRAEQLPEGKGVVEKVRITTANAVFAAITGISIASAAVFTRVAVPEMRAAGYTARFAVGIVGSSSVLGMLIPPSLLMIIYAMLTEQSMGDLFIAGIMPGILLSVCFAVQTILIGHFVPHAAYTTPVECGSFYNVKWLFRIKELGSEMSKRIIEVSAAHRRAGLFHGPTKNSLGGKL